jgi:hypothetical protein
MPAANDPGGSWHIGVRDIDGGHRDRSVELPGGEDEGAALARAIESSRRAQALERDRRLRAEQDAASELSRAMDLSKRSVREEAAHRARREEQAREEAAEALRAAAESRRLLRESMLHRLPEEPAPGMAACSVCISLTTGRRIRRRFPPWATASDLLDWAEGSDAGEEANAAETGAYGLLFTGPPRLRLWRESAEAGQSLESLSLDGVHLRAQLKL